MFGCRSASSTATDNAGSVVPSLNSTADWAYGGVNAATPDTSRDRRSRRSPSRNTVVSNTYPPSRGTRSVPFTGRLRSPVSSPRSTVCSSTSSPESAPYARNRTVTFGVGSRLWSIRVSNWRSAVPPRTSPGATVISSTVTGPGRVTRSGSAITPGTTHATTPVRRRRATAAATNSRSVCTAGDSPESMICFVWRPSRATASPDEHNPLVGATRGSRVSGRQLLEATETDYDFDPAAVTLTDESVLDRLAPAVREWWVDEFGEYVPENGGFFTPPQREAIPLIDEGTNTLVCSPTGSGKTLASFCSVIDELYRRDRDDPDGLDNSVYCLYVSPLKSLANDIHRNLAVPLSGIRERAAERGHETELRHAIRHGDTSDSDRQAMLETTPHVLNTTPETLAILLNSPKFKEKLRTVEYVVVDEIHSLAENKRGTHLSVSLERLENMTDGSPTRIGCSATVEPLPTVAKFLVGRESGSHPVSAGGASETNTDETSATDGDDSSTDESTGDDTDTDDFRDYEIVDTRFVREFDLQLECPTDDLIDTPRDVVNDRFYDRLHDLVGSHDNTLVFTNTRSGAERVLETLRGRFDAYDETNSGCHHGSMSKDQREAVEEDLKAGDVDVVTSSTSLELGIDMPHLDLVVQVGSPKSVASLLQRVGRAGHQLGETVEGRVIALDRDELVECSVMLHRATEGFVDRVFIPAEPQDVAAQQVYGMAINQIRPETDVLETLRRAYPYRDYTDADWEQLCRYLTADYDGLEEKNVYAKIWRDTNDPPDGEHHYEEYDVGRPLIGKRGRMARVIYMTNIGTIPDSFTCDVYTRSGDEWLGQLDEEYLDTLEKGDVFVLGGGNYEFRYRRGSKVYVDPTSSRATVPSWFSERLPLSYDLGREILSVQGEIASRLREGGRTAVRSWLRGFPIDENSVRSLARMFDQQRR
ncbi:MAG: Lhr-like helicase, partial [halophilic archaeon J07HB67]